MDYTQVFTVPYAMLETELGAADAAALEYPEAITGILAAQVSQDTRSYNLLTELPKLNGALQYEDMGSRTLVGRATLAAALDAEVESLVPAFAGLIGSPGPEESSLVLIGSGDDADNEMALILTSDVDGYTLRRGVLDTVPRGCSSRRRSPIPMTSAASFRARPTPVRSCSAISRRVTSTSR